MKRLVTDLVVFDAVNRTLNFSSIPGFHIRKLYAVINITRNQIIYALGTSQYGISAQSGNLITLAFDTSTYNNSDQIAIVYDDQISEIPGDGSDSTAIAVRALPQNVSRVGFAKTISGGVDPDFLQIVGSIAPGMTVNQTGGNLVLTSGTTARAETIIRSNLSWKGGIRFRARTTLSQRIANQNFFLELVDVIGDGLSYNITSPTSIVVTIPNNQFNSQNVGQSMFLGGFSGTGTFLGGRYAIASVSGNDVTFTVSGFAIGSGTVSLFGWNYYQLVYTGTTATNANFQTQRRGWANAAIGATIQTTASPGHLVVITGNDTVATFADGLTASATGNQLTPRANQVENVPDDANLRLQVRVQNLATAPASNTTFTIGFLAVGNYANQDVSLQDIRPMTSVSGLPVDVIRSVSLGISGTVTTAIAAGTNRGEFVAGSGIWFDDSSTALAANASFTGTSRDLTVTASATAWANASTYGQEVVVSAESDQTGTLWIEASRDGTTWRRIKSIATVAVPGGGFYAEIIHRPSWRHLRVGFTNGATLQTRFTIGSFLKAV